MNNEKFWAAFEDEVEKIAEKKCPGGKIRSQGEGKGLGLGQGKGPMGFPKAAPAAK